MANHGGNIRVADNTQCYKETSGSRCLTDWFVARNFWRGIFFPFLRGPAAKTILLVTLLIIILITSSVILLSFLFSSRLWVEELRSTDTKGGPRRPEGERENITCSDNFPFPFKLLWYLHNSLSVLFILVLIDNLSSVSHRLLALLNWPIASNALPNIDC